MLYYLFNYLNKALSFPGAGVFQYISFRAAMAVITSLTISMVFGRSLINYLKKKQVGEIVRDLGLEGQKEKQGTPTMGGLIILASILIPTLLFAKLHNIYIILMLITTVWLGLIGFIDDYIKVFKKDKKGLAGKFKIIGQVTLGLIVGATMYFHDGIVIREKGQEKQYVTTHNLLNEANYEKAKEVFNNGSVKSTKTTIPFVKNNEFDYSILIPWRGDNYMRWGWIIFIPIVILLITQFGKLNYN